MVNQLTTQRILSIDAFRGITILVMIFVNELAGVSGIPQWMKHMPADADAMTFVDLVFPAFLFIVGMSIPFAINRRLVKGDTFFQLQLHILWRTLGLIVLGLFMVNAEEDFNAAATGMSRSLWALLFYISAILVWNVYRFEQRWKALLLKGIGIAGLAVLAFIYRGGEDGTQYMQPHWWGILGLIGWAYLYSCIIYQLFKGHILWLVLMIAVCTGIYALGRQPAISESGWSWISSQKGHAAHTSIVLSGIVLTLLLFYDQQQYTLRRQRFTWVTSFTVLLLVAAYLLRPYFTISKIQATPSWCLYSAAICCIVFSLLYWLIDIKKISGWTGFFRPAAANPLLTYILPGIIYAVLNLLHVKLPPVLHQGAAGFFWCIVFAVVVMGIVRGLERLGIKLQL
jgi:heparan-alpha-glucosaminide N-acetyltransferase